MARTARKSAQSGVYYVNLRPVPDRPLFITPDECERFLTCLADEKERDAMDIFAYCCTPRTFCLVLREGLSGISAGVMRFVRAYANYINFVRSETGALFSGRFHSAPLETPEEILDATRFVHRYPLTIGHSMNYPHSSFKQFFKKTDLLSNEEVLSLLDSAIDYRLYCDSECDSKFKT